MPALASVDAAVNLTHYVLVANTTLNAATNLSDSALQVVCAWPVSGQYGPGSRVLYYILVAACVLARKAEWLRNACLAAALLFPAVAAVHGIVLAALHRNGAVDMDVFGAFQLCAVGILAAPITVLKSTTYFNDPGRNIIFIWTGLIFAGLLSLTVEFYRVQTSDCRQDQFGNSISRSTAQFPYGNATCGLTCSIQDGPTSPMRGGSANNVYVIPAPHRLTFGTGMLLAAACCIPSLLSLISMWNKILENNWKRRRNRGANKEGNQPLDEVIAGTNGATIGRMTGINKMVRYMLGFIEIPVFCGAILAILAIGELNFFSRQVRYQTEPVASIGQWAPILGTAFAAIGSLYVLGMKTEEPLAEESPDRNGVAGTPSLARERSPSEFEQVQALSQGTSSIHHTLEPIGTQASQTQTIKPTSTTSTADATDAGRRKVAQTFKYIGKFLGTAPPTLFDDSEFRSGRASDFPELPGEQNRNSALPQIREQYNPTRDAQGNRSPGIREPRSRATSFNGSVASGRVFERSPSISRATSPHLDTRDSLESEDHRSLSSADDMPRPRRRRDTLEVPSPTRRSDHARHRSFGSSHRRSNDFEIHGSENIP
ncbi:hypothetical protein EJ08DRAFT_583857 [Tothia fuscella]|uniref:Uncharacterized protein n=1 Tax=Tothia fuscella TaxID=1048955 RepID=A0A9P4NYA9_9PEZI|nr:hypothetical protein EJ08DRAFT_583857 [Tothia fuscella]